MSAKTDWLLAIVICFVCCGALLIAGLATAEARPTTGPTVDVCKNIKGKQHPSSIEAGVWVWTDQDKRICAKGFRHPDLMPDKG